MPIVTKYLQSTGAKSHNCRIRYRNYAIIHHSIEGKSDVIARQRCRRTAEDILDFDQSNLST